MDNKFYVSYEAARLLKEKGYDIKRDFLTPVYIENGNHIENGNLYWSNHEDLSDKIPAITKAEAIDWLESKGIVVDAHYYNEGYLPICRWGYLVHIFDNDSKEERIQIRSSTDNILFPTRLEAEEAAIIKACELL